MSLDLATCEQLKAAGFPQGRITTSLRRVDNFIGTPASIGGRYAESVACPNSDELLADMQRRWPLVSVEITVSGSIALAQSWNPDVDCIESSAGLGNPANPAEAIAALYLALATQEQG